MLRPLTWDDLEPVYRLTSNENIARYMRFDTHHSLDETRELLQEYLTEDAAFAIEADGSFAGVFVLKPDQDGFYSISTYLDEPYWNRGWMTKATAEAIGIARDQLRAEGLRAYIVEENMGSRRVVEKNGFFLEEIRHFPDFDSGLMIYQLYFEEEGQ